jgi:DNA-binding CsgD family transcriptional regulator
VTIRRSAYFRDEMGMRRADFEAVLSFLADVSHLEFDEPYPIDFLALLERLVPCDAVTYQELDHANRSFAGVGLGPDDEVDIDVYWTTGPCPTMGYRDRTGDLRAIRTSDLIDRLRYHELPIYREYFRPSRLEHIVDLGLPALPGRRRSFVLFRALGSSDFSERDRDVLEMLRPHLYRIEAHAALRRQLGEALREPIVDGEHDRYAALTPREHEIVQLVSSGRTNAEIATELWIAPSTVKKHLENIYGKIGIGRRAALAAGSALRT